MKKMIFCALVAALIAPAMFSCAEEKSPLDKAADAAKEAVDDAKDAAKDVKLPEAK